MAIGNPQDTLREQEERLNEILQDDIFGPPTAEKGRETTTPSAIDIDQWPMPQEDDLEEIFPAAGNMRDYADIDNLADTLSSLSAYSRSQGNGYVNHCEALYAFEKDINPQMVLGIPESTKDTIESDFIEQGFLDPENESLTSTAKAFLQGARTFMDEEDETENYRNFSQLATAVAGKYEPTDTLRTFFYTIETDDTLTDIAENIEATRKTADNRYRKLKSQDVFSGKPDERVITSHGVQAYNAIVAATHKADRTSDTEYLPGLSF